MSRRSVSLFLGANSAADTVVARVEVCTAVCTLLFRCFVALGDVCEWRGKYVQRHHKTCLSSEFHPHKQAGHTESRAWGEGELFPASHKVTMSLREVADDLVKRTWAHELLGGGDTL